MNSLNTPVLVGCGQLTEKQADGEGRLPTELMADAARQAGQDAGPAQAIFDDIDTIVAVGLTVDANVSPNPLSGLFDNVPKTVANLLGIEAAHYYYTATGGNTPQMLVNHFAEQIAQGQTGTVLLSGAEALRTMLQRFKLQLPFDRWMDSPGGSPTTIGDNRAPVNEHEAGFDLQTPANAYPLFENALRGKYQRTQAEHQLAMGEIYQRLNAIASANPLAWFPNARSAAEISLAGPDNRYIAYPYTKLLNSVIEVNQGAALILTSEARARELGIAPEKMIYLHGCADGHDHWFISDRVNYHSSPALRKMTDIACKMAGQQVAEMKYFDIYSCFPSALEIACDEFGLAHDDPRGLTLTGGLPYFGGPGNNYGMHAIAEMMNTLRANPSEFGMLNGNGWYVTKHSLGIYSSIPTKGDWQRTSPVDYQAEILQEKGPAFTETPDGKATIETYTVVHNRQGPERSIVIGRLQDGRRFMAETARDQDVLQGLMDDDVLGHAGTVSQQNGNNIFKLS